MLDKKSLIENLTGVNSSKLNYYVELKKRNAEILKQNSRLEILHQLSRDINLEMSTEDMIERAYRQLHRALPCDFLALALLRGDDLSMRAVIPLKPRRLPVIPAGSFVWDAMRTGKVRMYEPAQTADPFFRVYPELARDLRCMAIAPLFMRTAIQGLLLVGSTQKNAYAKEELGFLQHLADHLTISIQNARLYKEVSRAQQGWEATFKAVTDPILLLDPDYNILLDNGRQMPEMVSDQAGARGMKCYARLYGRDVPCEGCPMETLKKDPKPVFKRLETDSGLVLDLFYYPVLDENRRLTAITHIIKDVTQKTNMEAKLMHSARLAAIGEMAAGVAHELNSPMTVIIGTAQLIHREFENHREIREPLEDIVNCGLRCKRIIQNLLTFSRQDHLPMAETDINEEIERVLHLIYYQIDRNQISVCKNLDPNLPFTKANGRQIQQVLTNLLINARDALAGVDREKIIEVTSRCECNSNGQWIIISVKDNGIGIPAKNLQRVFTPFYTSKEESKGTGLGLSVSLGIAEAHGGSLEVESTCGQGSCFSLRLPVKKGPAYDLNI
ncbi:MAG: ATP-binding protein [Syntrophotalea acetylenica]|jgi:two-component system NtrC family sensor kinase|uniref:histidine kinase n=1 Tax=Syntrophotalea acetylenica TaxID=29542 RepID=A0A1L3GFK0_SYNAC|nr:sensor histidine kinase [Syntrophotalea acetylenica]APG24625.1 histidine kinase [Syntrophotalea acetylenica]APG45207.1 histidine kinase [Syntrophotalea acetylenica]MDD4456558.1 ATP-binding protein [Syntrophotalea acetylenica]MDY0262220.1 ATP-binding protein [Syntrophotalea acetylenica]